MSLFYFAVSIKAHALLQLQIQIETRLHCTEKDPRCEWPRFDQITQSQVLNPCSITRNYLTHIDDHGV